MIHAQTTTMMKKIRAYSPKNEKIDPMLNLDGVMLITSSERFCSSAIEILLLFKDILISWQVKTCMVKYDSDSCPLYIS